MIKNTNITQKRDLNNYLNRKHSHQKSGLRKQLSIHIVSYKKQISKLQKCFHDMIYNLLFPRKPDTSGTSLLLLFARIIFGLLLLSHGIQKWSNFQELSAVFPDPLGVGSSISLGLAVFAELACSIGFIFGILYRLALLPMISTMLMAFFVIHSADPFSVKELALVYLVVFVLMLVAGPGKYSVDHVLGKILAKSKKR